MGIASISGIDSHQSIKIMNKIMLIVLAFVSSCKSIDINPYEAIRSGEEYLSSSRIEGVFVNGRSQISSDIGFNGGSYSFISLCVNGKAFVSPDMASMDSMIEFMQRLDLDDYTGFQHGSGVYYLSEDTLNIVIYGPISSGSVPTVYGYTKYIGVLKGDSILAMKRVIVDLSVWSADIDVEYKICDMGTDVVC